MKRQSAGLLGEGISAGASAGLYCYSDDCGARACQYLNVTNLELSRGEASRTAFGWIIHGDIVNTKRFVTYILESEEKTPQTGMRQMSLKPDRPTRLSPSDPDRIH